MKTNNIVSLTINKNRLDTIFDVCLHYTTHTLVSIINYIIQKVPKKFDFILKNIIKRIYVILNQLEKLNEDKYENQII